MKPIRVIRINSIILQTKDGRRIKLCLTPDGLSRINPQDAIEFLKSIPGVKEIVEEYLNNPPSRRIDRLTRIRLIVLWLFSSGRPFPRREVNRVIRVICENDPPLAQDVPRIAQEVLACSVFEKQERGHWRVKGGELNPRGRPPKPGEPSATEEAFRLLRERAPEEFCALMIQNFRKRLKRLFASAERLARAYEKASPKEKEATIREMSLLIDNIVNQISASTISILIGLAMNGLITEDEIRKTLRRTRSTTFGEFMLDMLIFIGHDEEKRLDRLAARAWHRIALALEVWKEGKIISKSTP